MLRNLAMTIAALAVVLAPLGADAKGGGRGSGGRVHYGGGAHSSSHGGSYKGATGSSHKGGTYKNPKSDDRYGTHK